MCLQRWTLDVTWLVGIVVARCHHDDKIPLHAPLYQASFRTLEHLDRYKRKNISGPDDSRRHAFVISLRQNNTIVTASINCVFRRRYTYLVSSAPHITVILTIERPQSIFRKYKNTVFVPNLKKDLRLSRRSIDLEIRQSLKHAKHSYHPADVLLKRISQQANYANSTVAILIGAFLKPPSIRVAIASATLKEFLTEISYVEVLQKLQYPRRYELSLSKIGFEFLKKQILQLENFSWASEEAIFEFWTNTSLKLRYVAIWSTSVISELCFLVLFVVHNRTELVFPNAKILKLHQTSRRHATTRVPSASVLSDLECFVVLSALVSLPFVLLLLSLSCRRCGWEACASHARTSPVGYTTAPRPRTIAAATGPVLLAVLCLALITIAARCCYVVSPATPTSSLTATRLVQLSHTPVSNHKLVSSRLFTPVKSDISTNRRKRSRSKRQYTLSETETFIARKKLLSESVESSSIPYPIPELLHTSWSNRRSSSKNDSPRSLTQPKLNEIAASLSTNSKPNPLQSHRRKRHSFYSKDKPFNNSANEVIPSYYQPIPGASSYYHSAANDSRYLSGVIDKRTGVVVRTFLTNATRVSDKVDDIRNWRRPTLTNPERHMVHNDSTHKVSGDSVYSIHHRNTNNVAEEADGRGEEEGGDATGSTSGNSDPNSSSGRSHGGSASGGSSSSSRSSLIALVVTATLLTATLGLITCVVSHYRGDGTAAGSSSPPPPPPLPTAAAANAAAVHNAQAAAAHCSPPAPMLSVVSASAAVGVGAAAAAAGGMEGLGGGMGGGAAGRLHRHVTRELAVQRDRQVRLHSVHTDLELDLPPSIALPDGEELPYGSSARLHIRDPEQESEIYQKCIRPPPNRTVFESESPPPYRSSSAGLLGSLGGSSSSGGSGGGSSDWSGGSTPLVVRCHSMSSTSKRHDQQPTSATGQKTDFLQRTVKIFTGKKSTSNHHCQQPAAPTLPVVIVPSSRPRQHHQQTNVTLTSTTSRTKPNV